ncbi:MAG: polyphosphate:AMP phosphotransferase [Gemmatimonadota bacterium]
MFETAELGQQVPDETFRARVPELRRALLEAQFELSRTNRPLLVVFAGVDGAGKGESANMLNAWMDPRGIRTHAYGQPTDVEREMPRQWRYWRDLPAGGEVSIFLSAWYHEPFMDRVEGRTTLSDFERELDHIRMMERMWAEDGGVILKFWMHLGREQQKARFEMLEADPRLEWRVTEQDWDNWGRYDSFVEAAEELISRTSTGHAPWTIIEGADPNFRTLEVAEVTLAAMRQALARENGDQGPEHAPALHTPRVVGQRTVLDAVDLSARVAGEEYQERLPELQGRLNRIYRARHARGRGTVVVFEGWDAAGKGGAIRRIVPAVDTRHIEVHRIAEPTEEEKARHYLWRFWRRLPRAGEIAVFDRSWYGRVLVERIEGFATEEEWRRAYAEINDFEHRLIEHGIAVVKFWIHISPEKQEARFKSREKVPYKRYKLTADDWRNRERWDAYTAAVHEMVERTSSARAPWILVPGDQKHFARLTVLETLCGALALEE